VLSLPKQAQGCIEAKVSGDCGTLGLDMALRYALSLLDQHLPRMVKPWQGIAGQLHLERNLLPAVILSPEGAKNLASAAQN